MGCYGLGIGRILASIIEQNNDESGMILPMSITPFEVSIVLIDSKDEEQVTIAENIYNELKELGYPVLLGTSRKSVIGNVLNVEPKERLEGTIATTVLGIRDGVDIVRVHDVKENLKAAKMADAIYRR